MNYIKELAVNAIDELHRSIDYDMYCVIRDGLDYIETIQERDNELEDLWKLFGDVTMDSETECIEEQFLGFPKGTHREDVWRWFDERYSKGVYGLLYSYKDISQ